MIVNKQIINIVYPKIIIVFFLYIHLLVFISFVIIQFLEKVIYMEKDLKLKCFKGNEAKFVCMLKSC